MPRKNSLLPQTASQTAGPYVHIGLAPGQAGFDIYDQELGREIAGPTIQGERIRVEGVIIDGDGSPVLDALLEVWQADANGQYPDHTVTAEADFCGWGRATTDFETGLWRIDTIKPGAIAGPDGTVQAPHISLWIVARGINIGLSTRVYFEDEAELNAKDPLLTRVEDTNRRNTLIAKRQGHDDPLVYRFDVRLRGDGETVFLDV